MSLLAYAVHLIVTGIGSLVILVRGIRRGEGMAWVMLGSGVFYVIAITAQITLAYFPWLPHAALAWEPMDLGIVINVMTLGTALLRRYVRAQRRERELGRQLLDAARDERARVGRHLHDHVVQDMHYLHLQSQSLATSDEKQAATLKQLREGLLGAVQEVRRVAEDLQPLATRGTTLGEALETLARMLTTRFEVPVRVECDAPADLTDTLREHFYRVAHEAAMNACRHAAAQSVLIRVHRVHGSLQLEVSDDGRGFSPDSLSSERLGLRFLRDHAAFTGGRLQIDSKPGNGARIRYSIDLPPAEP
jgi:signal transduction histidine kinase